MTNNPGTAAPLITPLVQPSDEELGRGTGAAPPPVRVGGLARATVVLAHPHRLFLDSLVRLFDEIDAVQLVGCAYTEDQLIESVHRARPEIVIFEPFRPHPHGLKLLKHVRAISEGSKALVILQTVDPTQLLETLQNGAWGYFSYDTSREDVIRAIQVTRRGELWVKRGVMQRLLLLGAATEPSWSAPVNQVRSDSHGDLSRREREVAAQVVSGLCNKRIATTLKITESTVKAHLVSIFRKLDIQNRTQLVRYFEIAGTRINAGDRGDSSRPSAGA